MPTHPFELMSQQHSDHALGEVPYPHRGGLVATVKRYSLMLVQTDRGRWTVLLVMMLAILENTVYGSRIGGVAGIDPATMHWYFDLLTIPLFAFMLLLCVDLTRWVYHEEMGG